MGSSLRTRHNFLGGQISDNPLPAASTTATSSAFASLPVIAADQPEYLAITLDPDGLEGPPEIAWVTAHGTGASTVTLLRAQEGTAARLHYQDTSWVHAPTANDVGATEADLVMLRSQLSQLLAAGGGTAIRRWDGTAVGWDPLTFNGVAHSGAVFTTSGYQDIVQPPSGTVIPGVAGAASVTATAAGVPLSGWHSLWYEIPPGADGASLPSQFRVGAYTGGWVVPRNYLFICKRSGSDNRIYWANGETTDYWRPPVYLNGWKSYANSDNGWLALYRKTGQIVELRGLIQGDTATADRAFILPVGYRPGRNHIFSGRTNSGTSKEFRVHAGGEVDFMSRDIWNSISCTFYAEG